MKHPDKKNEMPLRDYSWIIFLPFVALGWMAFKAALENAAALIVWLVYSLFLLFPNPQLTWIFGNRISRRLTPAS